MPILCGTANHAEIAFCRHPKNQIPTPANLHAIPLNVNWLYVRT